MSYDLYQYKVLCEDQNHYNFVRGWLLKRGVLTRKIEPYGGLPPYPGSGKAHVQDHFAPALKELRSKQPYLKKVLIIVMDADQQTYDEAINDSSFSGLKAADNVFLIIPRRNIETWAHWLLEPGDKDVLDESKSYKPHYTNKALKKPTRLGEKLADIMTKMDTYDVSNMPDSLKRAIADVNTKLKEIV